jgi:hypothetical protein
MTTALGSDARVRQSAGTTVITTLPDRNNAWLKRRTAAINLPKLINQGLGYAAGWILNAGALAHPRNFSSRWASARALAGVNAS